MSQGENVPFLTERESELGGKSVVEIWQKSRPEWESVNNCK